GFTHFSQMRPSAIVEFLADLRRSKSLQLDFRKQKYSVAELANLCGISSASIRRLVRRRGLVGTTDSKGEDIYFQRDVVESLLQHRSRGIRVETSNHYLAAFKAFSKWLYKDKRAPYDPMVHLSRMNAEVEVRHERRPIPSADFARFLAATENGRPFRGLSGKDRLVLYCVASRTGLRASELGSLRPSSLDLDADPPTATVGAAYSKHRRRDIVPLPRDVAELLRKYMANRQTLNFGRGPGRL
ncbi:MAG TPA: tyrosine-type recombinase/integrase, partial [Gemmataceae bacterium]|nr:tyrosine-type recombinase/integrase [Gemmataceae bacterium]